MATKQTPLVLASGSDIFAKFERVSMNDHITAIFGASAGAETLARCTPVGYNDSTGFYGAWVAADPTVLEVDTGGATGGTFTITVDGITTATIAFDATEEATEAALMAIGIVATVALAAGVYTVTFGADTQVAVVPTVTGDVSSLTGGTGEAATPTAGTSTYGTSKILGFIWPDEVGLDASLQVHGEVMVKGRISYTYIEPTVDSGDVAALQVALKSTALGRGIIVEDLANIH